MLIVVTGASRGIGFELVKVLGRIPKCTVVAISRNTAALEKISAKQKNILLLKADISSAGGRKKTVDFLKAQREKIFGIVHNAGKMLNKPFGKISEKELGEIYATNVFAPFILTQDLLKLFSKPAHIVCIGSMGGVNGTAKFPGLSAYSSSKGALAILAECMAEELKPLEISVNCLALGAVQTEMLSQAFPGYKAPLEASHMAEFIANFVTTQGKLFNGKTLPVSSSTP